MSENPTAVFLSYASQDAERAQHLADSLRSAGIDVWFDQSELRGGDAWDAMIRKRIKGCALFIPVVSHNTEARQEGYFRLEWKLAVDRSHSMSEDRAFIVPVLIDEIDEATARVPELFRARQWARLINGEVPLAFVQQMQRLIDIPNRDASTPLPARVAKTSSPTKVTTRAMPWRLVGAVTSATVVTVAAISYLVGSSRSPTSNVAQARGSAPEKAVPASDTRATVEPAREVVPQTTEARNKPAVSERRPAAAASLAENPLKQVSAEAPQSVASSPEAPAPLRIMQGAPLGPLEEPKHWAVQVELAFWDTIRNSSIAEDYDEYLRQYPEGRFAGLARNRIKAAKSKRKS